MLAETAECVLAYFYSKLTRKVLEIFEIYYHFICVRDPLTFRLTQTRIFSAGKVEEAKEGKNVQSR